MLAGMQLDVFTPLKDGPLTCAEIADVIGVRSDKLGPLLYALVNADLLTIAQDRFSNTPESDEFLVRGRPRYYGGRHELLSQQWHCAMQTAGSIRDGKPRMKLDFADPTDGKAGVHLPWHNARGLCLLASRWHHGWLPRVRHIWRILVAVPAALRSVPGLRATIIDLPNAVSAAESFIAEAGLGDRVSMLAGDVVTAPPALHFDAAVVKSVVQVLSRDNANALLRHVGQAMAPGGHIFIVGQMLDDSRTSPAANVGFNLVLLNVYGDGEAFTEGEHRMWLTDAGFGHIVIEAGTMPGGGASLIAARKLPIP